MRIGKNTLSKPLKNQTMKSIVSFLFVILLIPAISHAQHTRLNGYAVYVFDDKFDSYYDNNNYYEGKFKGGLQWGVGLE